MPTSEVLPNADRQAIESAVRSAEQRTGCEIVVTVVGACDGYHHASWKAATCGALAGALVTAAATRGLEVWGIAWAWLLLPAPAAAALAWLASQMPPVRRFLATPEVLEQRVTARAASAFLEAQVFRTAGRTGVLLFLAEFERRVVVLADDGVRARVPPAAFSEVASTVSARVRPGAIGAALLQGVERCAAALEAHGFDGRGTPGNQLSDSVRVEE